VRRIVANGRCSIVCNLVFIKTQTQSENLKMECFRNQHNNLKCIGITVITY